MHDMTTSLLPPHADTLLQGGLDETWLHNKVVEIVPVHTCISDGTIFNREYLLKASGLRH